MTFGEKAGRATRRKIAGKCFILVVMPEPLEPASLSPFVRETSPTFRT
jgi:hypothetical protein